MVINELTVLIWIVCGIGSFLIAQNRGATNAPTWFLVGIIFGPIGVLLAIIGARGPKVRPVVQRPDAMASLNALAQLRANGHVTEEEYEAKKRELLARV
jgi:hypothetical protein